MAGGVWSALGAALTNGMGAFQDQSRFQMQAKRQQDQDLQIKQQRDEDLKRQRLQEELTKFNFLQQLAEARAKATSGLPEESYGPADVVGGQDAIDTVKSFKPTIPAERLPGMIGLPGLNNGKPEMPKGAPQTFDAPVGGNERPNPLKLNPIVGPSLPSMGVDQGISLPRQTREQQQQLQHQALIEKLMTTPQKVGEGEKVVVPGMGTIAQGAPKPKKFQSEWIEGPEGKRNLANYDPDLGSVELVKGPDGKPVGQAPPPRDPLVEELTRARLAATQQNNGGGAVPDVIASKPDPATANKVDARTGYTPNGLWQISSAFALEGKLPSMGMGNQGQVRAARMAVQNMAAARAQLAGVDLPTLRAEYRANATSLNQLVPRYNAIAAFEETANRNLELALQQNAKVGRTGARVVNRFLNWAKGELTPATGLTQLETYVYTAAREYAKVTMGATGGAALTDTANREASHLLDAAMSPEAFSAAADAMRNDMMNAKGSLEDQIGNVSNVIGAFLRAGDDSPRPEPKSTLPNKPGAAPTGGGLTYSDYLKSRGQ